MAKRSKKKTFAELLKTSEEEISRKSDEYIFDPSMVKQELKDRIDADIAKAEETLDHERTVAAIRETGLNFASRALIAGLGAFVNSLGVTVTHGAESADIITEQAEEWVDISAICNLIDKNRGEEKSEAYLRRLIDEDNARKNPPKAEEIKPAIRKLDLED